MKWNSLTASGTHKNSFQIDFHWIISSPNDSFNKEFPVALPGFSRCSGFQKASGDRNNNGNRSFDDYHAFCSKRRSYEKCAAAKACVRWMGQKRNILVIAGNLKNQSSKPWKSSRVYSAKKISSSSMRRSPGLRDHGGHWPLATAFFPSPLSL